MKYSEKFKARLLDPEAWQQTARQLLEAAALLEPKINEFWQNMRSQPPVRSLSWRPWNDEFIAIYFMLCAFAIENLLKGKIVKKKQAEIRALIQDKLAFPKILNGHDLYQLTLEAGFPELAAYDERLLRTLSRCSIWYGRYPIPLTPVALKTTHSSNHYDFDISLTQYSSADRDDIQRIIQEVSFPSSGA